MILFSKSFRKSSAMLIILTATIVFLGGSVLAGPLPEIKWRCTTHVSPGAQDVIDKFGLIYKPGGAKVLTSFSGMIELSRRVKERTNGKFIIKNYSAKELFAPKEYYKACSVGAVEMLNAYGAFYGGINPIGYIDTNIPFGTKSLDNAYDLYFKTNYIDILQRAHAKNNIRYICPMIGGSHGFVSKFPIRSIDDLKGKKFRGPGVMGLMCKALGAVGLPIATSEQYTALQRGTIDGIIFTHQALPVYGIFEVAKYVSLPPVFAPTTDVWLVNMDAWKKLPKEYKAILTEECQNLWKWVLKTLLPKSETGIREYYSKQGVEYITLSDKVYNEMRSLCMPLWGDLAKKSKECKEAIEVHRKNLGI